MSSPCPAGPLPGRLIILLLAAASLSLAASAGAVPPTPDTVADWQQRLLEPWRWSTFSTSAGLPGVGASDVSEPPGGRPWALTAGGLASFDGYQWHPVPEDSGLPAERPVAIAAGPDGRLLVIADGALFQGDEHGFSQLASPDEAGGGAFHEVAALADGHLLARRGTGLWQWDGARWAPLMAERWHREERVYRLIGGGEARVWAQTQEHTYLLAEEGWRPAPGGRMPDRLVTETSLRPGLVLGLFTSGHTRLLDLREEYPQWSAPLATPEPMRAAVSVAPHGDDSLWVASDDGVRIFRAGSRLWTRWEHADSGPLSTVTTIEIARDGTAWLGTVGGLVEHRPDGSERLWTEAADSSVGHVTGLVEDVTGSLWVTSSYSVDGALELTGGVWRRHGLASGTAAPRLFRARIGPDGRPWFTIGKAPGVLRLGDDGLVPWQPAAQLDDARVYDIAFVGDDEIWLATGSGLALWQRGQWRLWSANHGLRNADTWLLAAGSDGVWFSDGLNGVGTIDARGQLRYETSNEGLPDDAVRDLLVDREGVLWVATERGLGVRHPVIGWQTIDGRAGLSTTHLQSVMAVPDRVYLGTSGAGTLVLDRTSLPDRPPRLLTEVSALEGGTLVGSWRALPFDGFLYPGPVLSRSRLDDGPWSDWGPARVVHLHGVSPGNHTLSVQAHLGISSTSIAQAAGSVRVPYPLHRRPEVLLPLLLLAGGFLAALGTYVWRRRQFVRDLHASRSRLAMMLEQMPASLWVVTPELTVASLEGALATELGWAPEEIVGRHVRDIAAEAGSANALVYAHERAVAGASADLDQMVRGHDLRIHLDPLRDRHGQVVGAIGVALDLSDRSRLERQLLQARKLEAIGTLAGGVAHDFNNLLVGVRGFAELALEQLDPDHPARDDLAEVLHASDRAAELVSQLLTLGRRRPGNPRRLDLNVVLEQMRSLLEHLVGRSVRLGLHPSPQPIPVLIDRVQLEQVIVNLVANARDAMPDGGELTLHTSRAEIDAEEAAAVSGAAPGRYACLLVRDSGTGIDPEVLDRIFEPFFTTRSGTGGTGLGLATAYGIVQQSKGWIEVHNEPGGGATFSVFLPWNEGTFADDAVAPEPATAAPAAHSPARLLVVEQDDLVRALMRRWIGERGYTALYAASAKAVAEEEDLESFDLLILGTAAQDLGEGDLARRLRERHPDCRILLVSGQHAPAVPLPWAGRGVDFLAKPFVREELIGRIESLLAG